MIKIVMEREEREKEKEFVYNKNEKIYGGSVVEILLYRGPPNFVPVSCTRTNYIVITRLIWSHAGPFRTCALIKRIGL